MSQKKTRILVDQKCPVCFDNKKRFKTLKCPHKLCLDCLVKMTSMSCPVCRADFSATLTAIQKKKITKNMEKRKIVEIREREARDLELARQQDLRNRQPRQAQLYLPPDIVQEFITRIMPRTWRVTSNFAGINSTLLQIEIPR